MGKIFETMKLGRHQSGAPQPVRTDAPHAPPALPDDPDGPATTAPTSLAKAPFSDEDQVPFIEIPEPNAQKPTPPAPEPGRGREKKAQFLASPWPGIAPAAASALVIHRPDADLAIREYRQIFSHLEALLGPRPSASLLLVPHAADVAAAALTANLGLVAAQESRQPVLLIDAARQDRGVGGLFGLLEAPGWEELVAGLEPAQVVQASGCAGVDVIPSGRRLAATTSRLWAQRTHDLLRHFSSHYRWLILQGPAITAGPWWLLLAAAVDGISLVVQREHHPTATDEATQALASQAGRLLGTILLS